MYVAGKSPYRPYRSQLSIAIGFSGDFLRVNLSFQDHVFTKYVSLYFINLALLFDDIMTWMDLFISRVLVETIFEYTIALS